MYIIIYFCWRKYTKQKQRAVFTISFNIALMKILIVAATNAEIQPLLDFFGDRRFDILITGVGMVATAFTMGQRLAANQYDLAINLGIAGSFDRTLKLGEVVEIENDTLAELGAENGDEFIPITALGFGENTFGAGNMLFLPIKRVHAITVNTAHGEEKSIQKVLTRLQPKLESMEGAAFFYACKKSTTPSLQIRAISNYVEKRNRENWQIGLAIKNLNDFAIELLDKL